MGLFNLFTATDINEGVEEWKKTPNGILIDVRTPEEYAQGHIPGSVNIPLNEIDRVCREVPKKDTPIFVHCLIGVRSGSAASYMKQQGYSNVMNIGGIADYRGKKE